MTTKESKTPNSPFKTIDEINDMYTEFTSIMTRNFPPVDFGEDSDIESLMSIVTQLKDEVIDLNKVHAEIHFLEQELSDAKWLVKAYSKTMNLNLEAYEKQREKSRQLLTALEDLYFFTPDFPDKDEASSDWDHGLEKATRNAKKAIEDAKRTR